MARCSHELFTAPYAEQGVTFAFVCFGRHIAISLSDASLLERVVAVLPPGWIPTTPRSPDTRVRVDWVPAPNAPHGQAGYCLWHDDTQRQWSVDAEEVLMHLEAILEHDVAEFSHPWLFMHAGVVGWDGRAIILPGASHAGKSTLVAALVEAGATYYSDEFAVLDAQGGVLPFPRHLSLRDGPLGPTGRHDLSRHASGPDEKALPLLIGRVILLRYQPTSDLHLDRLTPGAAIMEMCKHMVPIQRRPEVVLGALATIAQRVPVLIGERGDARIAARWIMETDVACMSNFKEPFRVLDVKANWR